MRYLSVCSGIEAASVAWHPLGWTPAGFSEIEPFPRAVLEHRLGAVAVNWDHQHVPGSNITPLFGDFTKIEEHHVGPIDLLVGGTPCQSFSVAGKRLGLDDPRGHLTLEYLALAQRLRPRWLVWENVPGVLSDDSGRTLGTFLRLLGQLGYRWAYRVLDAQYVRVDGFGRAVPQRRRRVFVVGYLGNDARAAAVLFDRESLRGNPAPRRQAGKGVAPTIAARTRGGGGLGTDFDCDGGLIAAEVTERSAAEQPTIASEHPYSGTVSSKWAKGAGGPAGDECQNLVAHALRADGFDASEDGTGRGTPIVPVACIHSDAISRTGTAETPSPDAEGRIRLRDAGMGVLDDGSAYNLTCAAPHAVAFAENSRAELRLCGGDGQVAAQLTAGGGKPGQGQPCIAFPAELSGTQCASSENLSPALSVTHTTAVAFDLRGREGGAMPEGPHETANVRAAPGGSSRSYVAHAIQAGALRENPASGPDGVGVQEGVAYTLEARSEVQAVAASWAVRRLTPRECERLQGFPDDWTLIPWRNKPAADGPRYKAIGNSMAVNCMRWIGERIAAVEALPEGEA
jgi:DNA (cytosine-5)-methyltransferase 1